MVKDWLLALIKGAGMLFLNPLFYWTLLLVLLSGSKRIKKERNHFGTKVFPLFTEWAKHWGTVFTSGLVLSVLCLAAGIVFSMETIAIMSIISILLSIALRFTYLSPGYTLGLTSLLLLFIPIFGDGSMFELADDDLFSSINFTGLAILLGFFLIVEAIMIYRVKRTETFPELIRGKRGKWIGQHHVKKAALIPFFAFIPGDVLTSFVPFWPSVSLLGDTYSMVLIPFLIGFDFKVKGEMIQQATKKTAAAVLLLGVFVLITAIGSVFLSWLAVIAVVISIAGREYIRYRQQIGDEKRSPNFYQGDKGLKILAVIPNSPADQLSVYAGETIMKVNGRRVQTTSDFYQALQGSGAFFKMEIMDDAGEVRFVQRAFYQGEHYELGILFVKERYRHAGADVVDAHS